MQGGMEQGKKRHCVSEVEKPIRHSYKKQAILKHKGMQSKWGINEY